MMNASLFNSLLSSSSDGETYLFVTDSQAALQWLQRGLQRRGTVLQGPPHIQAIKERIAGLRPRAVFIDFSGAQASPAAELLGQLRQDRPDLPMLGTGISTESATLLRALRAGVDDFIDTSASEFDLNATVAGVLKRRARDEGAVVGQHAPVKSGRGIALLGARPGLGVTTLATHLALLLHDAVAIPTDSPGPPAEGGVVLLDLGVPTRDGLLYLDLASEFSFIDGMKQVRRLDRTLAHTALARHANGLTVLPRPAEAVSMPETATPETIALMQRLPELFDHQVIDVGGCANVKFIAQTVRQAERTWVVCDQSIGAIVSTAQMLRDLESLGLERGRFGLVVNQFDGGVAIAASDIAERLQLPLAHVLPQRRAALLAAGGQGKILARVSPKDPYVHAVRGMVRVLRRPSGEDSNAVETSRRSSSTWTSLVAPLVARRREAKEGRHP
jgi:pilus assembly protein CpaE